MPDIIVNGMAIAPNVIDTIVTLALKEVPGVDSEAINATGIKALFSPASASQKVNVTVEDDESLAIEVTIRVLDGYPINELVQSIRSSIVDAVVLQTGINVSRVDINIDGIRFLD
jgi:uncharacterized alkaline shock family protein YloU